MTTKKIFRKSVFFFLCFSVCANAYAAGGKSGKTVKRVTVTAPIQESDAVKDAAGNPIELDALKKSLAGVEQRLSDSARDAKLFAAEIREREAKLKEHEAKRLITLEADLKAKDAKIKEKDVLLAKQNGIAAEAQKLKEYEAKRLVALEADLKAKDARIKEKDVLLAKQNSIAAEAQKLIVKMQASSASEVASIRKSPEFLLGAMVLSDVETVQLLNVGHVSSAYAPGQYFFLLDQDQMTKLDKLVGDMATIKRIGEKDGKFVVGIAGDNFNDTGMKKSN